MLAIPAILAVIVFVPIGNRILYWSLFVLMFILVYAFHIMEDVVPMKDITAQLGTDDFFSLKCGYVKIINGQKAELQKGVMVIYAQTVLFYVRAKASGGARLVQSIPAETIDTYTPVQGGRLPPGRHLHSQRGRRGALHPEKVPRRRSGYENRAWMA